MSWLCLVLAVILQDAFASGKDCSPTLIASGNLSSIYSENYPFGYARYTDCTWMFKREGSEYIQLSFTEYDGSVWNCSEQNVTVYDGGSYSDPVIGEFCGGETMNVTGTNKYALVQLLTDSAPRGQGLHIQYMTANGYCSFELIARETADYIFQPIFRYGYRRNDDCTWRIRREWTNLEDIQLIFTEGDTDVWNCSRQNITVYDGQNESYPIIGVYCGGDMMQLKGSTHYISARFRTPSEPTGRHLSILYKTGNRCSRELASAERVSYTYSEVYSSGYIPNSDCTWRFRTEGRDFTYLVVSENNQSVWDCSSQNVTIHDGTNDSYPIIGQYCGGEAMEVNGTTNYVFVRLRTGPEPIGHGLKIEYKLEKYCSHELTVGENISDTWSKNYPLGYERYLECKWLFRRKGPVYIQLIFSEYDRSIWNCSEQNVTVYNGPSDLYPAIGEFCGGDIVNVTGRFDEIFVRLLTGSAPRGQGLQIQYYTATKCSHRLVANETVSNVFSDNYGLGHARYTDCTWLFQREGKGYIHLAISESGQSWYCSAQNVMVYNGPNDSYPLIGRYCGSTAINVTGEEKIFVRFRTYGSPRGRGLRIQYQTVAEACLPTTLIVKPGEGTMYVTSPNFPYMYLQDLRCEWVFLTLNDSYRVRIALLSVDVEDSINCSKDSIEAFDGTTDRDSRSLGRWCGERRPNGYYFSSGSSMTLVFRTDNEGSGEGFLISVVADYFTNPKYTTTSKVYTTTSTGSTTSAILTPVSANSNAGAIVGGVGSILLVGVIAIGVILVKKLCGPRNRPQRRSQPHVAYVASQQPNSAVIGEDPPPSYDSLHHNMDQPYYTKGSSQI